MLEENQAEDTYAPAPHSSPLKPNLAVLVIIYICGSAYFLVQMRSQLNKLAAGQDKATVEQIGRAHV